MPINTAEDLSRKERDLLERQRQAARRRECQAELMELTTQAHMFINLHVAHLQQLNSLNNKMVMKRFGSVEQYMFRHAIHGQASGVVV